MMRKEQVLIPMIRGVVHRPRLAEVMFRFDRWGNPFCDAVYRDPYPMLEVMRRDGPVSYRPLYQQWFVLGYDEVRQILGSSTVAVGDQVETLLAVRPYSLLTPRNQRFFRNFLVLTDPPDHTRMRRLVSRAFTPRRIRDLETRCTEIAADLLNELDDQPEPDVVEGFNARLPVNVISDMLGVPAERWEWARRTTTEIIKLLDPFEGFDPVVMNATIDEIFDYYGELAEQRRAEPKDDLVSALAAAEDDGDRLDHEELISMIALLMAAGHETTAGLLGNAMVALAANPDQRSFIRENPDLWPNAVEELVRFDTSVRADPRVAEEDLRIADKVIPAGSNLVLMMNAANRDPRRYERPDELLLDREDPDPISFGHGIHHCLGAALARMELRIGLQGFLDAFGDYEIDSQAVEWKRSTALRGPVKLPIRRQRLHDAPRSTMNGESS